MYKIYIDPYNAYSKSYKLLNSVLKVPKGDEKPFCVNWGRTKLKYAQSNFSGVLNKPKAVGTCSDKLRFFNYIKDSQSNVNIPEFTDDVSVALDWVSEGCEVLGRNVKGHSGTDIVFSSDKDRKTDWISSDFFTKYIKKKYEFRIHVFKGEIIEQQRKVLSKVDRIGRAVDPSEIDFRVRTYPNGFIFQKNDINVPEDVKSQALEAVSCVGLDFGAVDVIYNSYHKRATVLEINTAPGLQGTTVDRYVEAIKKCV